MLKGIVAFGLHVAGDEAFARSKLQQWPAVEEDANQAGLAVKLVSREQAPPCPVLWASEGSPNIPRGLRNQ